MQLTGPVFLFLFLPLSLLPAVFVPHRWRPFTLAALSMIWYFFANRQNPWGILQIALLVPVCSLLAYLPQRIAKIRTVLGVMLPVCALAGARVLVVLQPKYEYPMGLGLIALAAVSLAVDRARGAQKPRSPFVPLAYLLFFPTLSAGPVTRYRHFAKMLEKHAPSPALFCEGIYYYALGYVKRLAIAAVLTRCLDSLLENTATSPLFLFTALFLSLLFLYFFITGTADMAHGIAAMYGLRLPRDRADLLRATAPHTLFFSIFHSFYRYFLDYVARPLRRLLPRAWGELAAALALWLCLFLFLGLNPVFLPLALPLLFSMLAARLWPRKKRLPSGLRLLSFVLSAVLCSLPAFALLAGSPAVFLGAVQGVTNAQPASYYTFFLAVADSRYLIYVLLFLLGVSLVRFLFRFRKPTPRVMRVLSLSLFPVLLLGFVLTLLFFMPQFPQYATALFPTS